MAIIKYQIKENNNIGTHSFYAQAVSYSTLNINDLSAEIAESVGISPHVVRMILERYAEVAVHELLRGHRVKLGELLTLYPQISASVKDVLDEQGNVVTKATANMVDVSLGKSTIGATITQALQQEFAKSVSWKKVTDDDDDAAKDGGTTDDGTSGSGDGGELEASSSN